MGNPVVGKTYTLVCTVLFGSDSDTPIVHWEDPFPHALVGNITVVSPGIVQRNLTFSPLRQSHEMTYTCRATLSESETTTATKGIEVTSKSTYSVNESLSTTI